MLILLGYFLCLISLLPLFIAYITKPKKVPTPYGKIEYAVSRHTPVILKARKAVPFDDVMRNPKASEIWATTEVKHLLTDSAANYVTIWTERDDFTDNFIINGQLIIYDGGEHDVD